MSARCWRKHELLVCIDGDALLDPHALRWIARAFRRGDVGGLTGNPRIRNRTTLLGRLQVGEFSSIIGLIKRAQTTYGRLFTVSGVICAFRKRALQDAGWWSPRTLTDDIDVTWRVQMAGWRVVYEPNAIVWILMPETLQGPVEAAPALGRGRRADDDRFLLADDHACARRRLLPTYINYLLSIAVGLRDDFLAGSSASCGRWASAPPAVLPGFQLIPEWWGLTLTLTYLAQALVSHLVERRYEPDMLRSLFWMIWYPLAFWMISTRDHRRRPAARAACGRARRPGSVRTGDCDEQPPPRAVAAADRRQRTRRAGSSWRDVALTLRDVAAVRHHARDRIRAVLRPSPGTIGAGYI